MMPILSCMENRREIKMSYNNKIDWHSNLEAYTAIPQHIIIKYSIANDIVSENVKTKSNKKNN